MKEFEIYAEGLVCTSVCTSLSVEEATVRLNQLRPSGIMSQWVKSEDKTFISGEPNPCPCNTHPDTHKHYLFNC